MSRREAGDDPRGTGAGQRLQLAKSREEDQNRLAGINGACRGNELGKDQLVSERIATGTLVTVVALVPMAAGLRHRGGIGAVVDMRQLARRRARHVFQCLTAGLQGQPQQGQQAGEQGQAHDAGFAQSSKHALTIDPRRPFLQAGTCQPGEGPALRGGGDDAGRTPPCARAPSLAAYCTTAIWWASPPGSLMVLVTLSVF